MDYPRILHTLIYSTILYVFPLFAQTNNKNFDRNIPTDIIAVRAILDSNGLSKVKVGDVVDINNDMRVIALNLQNRKLTRLPPNIGKLSALTILNLSRNQLRSLPDSICALENLTMLNLSRNKLKSLPENIGRLSRLEILDLSRNRLRTLPIDIQSLHKLEDLMIFNNRIESLPEQFGGVQSLNRLKADNNMLKTLPESFCFLTGLKHISLQDNNLSELPECISDLSAHISVKGNNLCQLPRIQEDWVYKNSNNYNWKSTQACKNRVVDISDEELPPEAFRISHAQIPEPLPAAKRHWMSASTTKKDSNGLNVPKSNMVKANTSQLQLKDSAYTSTLQNTGMGGEAYPEERDIQNDMYPNIVQTELSTDAPTRRSSNDVDVGIFEGFFIERKLAEKIKKTRVSFIFSSEAFMGTTLYDYYDSTQKAIILDFYNNTMKSFSANQFLNEFSMNIFGKGD